jgi:CubicO group peptidase (beta-lactamase class C family)
MKVEDLLTMSSGLGWVEGDDTYRQMYASSRDWVQFVLDLPMKADPGRRFNYSSGNSHILSAIIQAKSGMKASEFAQAHLFGPLGIHGWFWEQDPAGMAIGGWGLRLPPREMAKLGYLYLHNGMWDGKQIVPASWVRSSTEKHIATDGAWDYGYQWWVDPRVPMYAALGRFGQSIFVVPRLDMVAVFTAQIASNDPEAEMVRNYLVPACAAVP